MEYRETKYQISFVVDVMKTMMLTRQIEGENPSD